MRRLIRDGSPDDYNVGDQFNMQNGTQASTISESSQTSSTAGVATGRHGQDRYPPFNGKADSWVVKLPGHELQFRAEQPMRQQRAGRAQGRRMLRDPRGDLDRPPPNKGVRTRAGPSFDGRPTRRSTTRFSRASSTPATREATSRRATRRTRTTARSRPRCSRPPRPVLRLQRLNGKDCGRAGSPRPSGRGPVLGRIQRARPASAPGDRLVGGEAALSSTA